MEKQLQNNITIALFDGWVLKHGCTDRYVRKRIGGDGYNIVRQDKLMYHEGSWNVIMPVVKKLFDIQAPIVFHENLADALTSVDYNLTYQRVVEFIEEWVNTQKK
jgi:hypothetical protein